MNLSCYQRGLSSDVVRSRNLSIASRTPSSVYWIIIGGVLIIVSVYVIPIAVPSKRAKENSVRPPDSVQTQRIHMGNPKTSSEFVPGSVERESRNLFPYRRYLYHHAVYGD